jgi:uncharacterized membrane protein YkoI
MIEQDQAIAIARARAAEKGWAFSEPLSVATRRHLHSRGVAYFYIKTQADMRGSGKAAHFVINTWKGEIVYAETLIEQDQAIEMARARAAAKGWTFNEPLHVFAYCSWIGTPFRFEITTKTDLHAGGARFVIDARTGEMVAEGVIIGQDQAIEIARKYAAGKGWAFGQPLNVTVRRSLSGAVMLFEIETKIDAQRCDKASFIIDAKTGELVCAGHVAPTLGAALLNRLRCRPSRTRTGIESGQAIEIARKRAAENGWAFGEPLTVVMRRRWPGTVMRFEIETQAGIRESGKAARFVVDAKTGEIVFEGTMIEPSQAIEVAQKYEVEKNNWMEAEKNNQKLREAWELRVATHRDGSGAAIRYEVNRNLIDAMTHYAVDARTGEMIYDEHSPSPPLFQQV